jgi:type I restriction enzyme R subunit
MDADSIFTLTKAEQETLLKYQLHKDDELFEKSYNYISEHY